jgi:C-terminal processing protease CtpA/Prc
LKIGYIRIPSYSPLNATTAVTAFQGEMAYFQANTDGLVIDNMRNPGGSTGYANLIAGNLMTTKWRSLPFQVRATSDWVMAISSALTQIKAAGLPQDIVNLYQAILDAIAKANAEMRGLTDPIPLDDVTIDRDPAKDSKGNLIAYTKPLIVLVDELSASAAEVFAATIQDNGRGPLVGWRTMGAGGNSDAWEAGSYSQGIATLTESLMIRKNVVFTPDYPAAPYVENIGVRPEIQVDYMTRANLIQNGKPFVDAFVAAIVAQIKGGGN